MYACIFDSDEKKVRLENVLQTKLFDNVNGKKEHAKLCKNPITHRVTSTHIELCA